VSPTARVTAADDGQAVTLAVGDTLVVQLDPVGGTAWSEPVSGSPALVRASVEPSGGGVTARFTAAQAGTAEVTAAGPQDYRLTVTVTG